MGSQKLDRLEEDDDVKCNKIRLLNYFWRSVEYEKVKLPPSSNPSVTSDPYIFPSFWHEYFPIYSPRNRNISTPDTLSVNASTNNISAIIIAIKISPR